MDIRILPSNIANMIAAGEVVQRPSSVVKELMENAIDAQADEINVIVTDAGRTLVQVIDNGCGMSPDQAVLCFERHATSKIVSAEDLDNIRTFGFRGEALASIAAVAEVTLKTRRKGESIGCQVDFADSKHLATVETSCPEGSNFAVRNLFYNVPARRKFLKSDNVEFKHIAEEFIRIALTRPDIGFTLVNNSKTIYSVRPVSALKFRIRDLIGKNIADSLVGISADTTLLKVDGFVCRPDLSRKTIGNQFFFVNGRYFRSSYLHKAVMKAYESMIPDGVTPSYFLYLKTEPHTVDVNIHPTKTEVKFEDESVIFQIVFAAVKEALGKNSFADKIDFESGELPQMPVFGKNYNDYRPEVSVPSVNVDPTYNPFEKDSFAVSDNIAEVATSLGGVEWADAPQEQSYSSGRANTDYQKYVERHQDYGNLLEDKSLPGTSIVVLRNKYIITQVPSGLLVVHIGRARERIFYERFISAMKNRTHVSETALFPVQVNVGATGLALLEDNSEALKNLGFDISPFGTDTVVVNGVPEGLSSDPSDIEALIADVLVSVEDRKSSFSEILESETAEKLARAASMRGRNLTGAQQAQKLIDTLFGCENSEYTSNGRKIMTILPIDEIDKKF